MTWLCMISSMPATGDRKTGGQGSPPHGDRYPFIPSLHVDLKKFRTYNPHQNTIARTQKTKFIFGGKYHKRLQEK